jgi:hypothetical protein
LSVSMIMEEVTFSFCSRSLVTAGHLIGLVTRAANRSVFCQAN